jgi:hypothetical protein
LTYSPRWIDGDSQRLHSGRLKPCLHAFFFLSLWLLTRLLPVPVRPPP